jgi:predicted DsbA family dithiol-disulfide isomerase
MEIYMTTIKVLGTGCVTCKRLLADVNDMVAKNNWQAQVEYVTDLPTIMSYGIMYTPALVVDETVMMTGHLGAARVEQAIRQQIGA